MAADDDEAEAEAAAEADDEDEASEAKASERPERAFVLNLRERWVREVPAPTIGELPPAELSACWSGLGFRMGSARKLFALMGAAAVRGSGHAGNILEEVEHDPQAWIWAVAKGKGREGGGGGGGEVLARPIKQQPGAYPIVDTLLAMAGHLQIAAIWLERLTHASPDEVVAL